MRLLICPECQRSFVALQSRRIFCGTECAAKARRARARKAYSTNKQSPKVFCAFGECEKAVWAKGLCTGHDWQRRMGQELRPLREYGRTPEPPRILTCKHCGEAFAVTAGTGDARSYCSPECGKEAKRIRDREQEAIRRTNRPPCEFPGCVNLIAAKGLCGAHRLQQIAGKPLTPLRPQVSQGVEAGARRRRPGAPARPCTFPGCDEPARGKSLCDPHRNQHRKTSIPTERFVAFAARLGDLCSYCHGSLDGKFEIDHAHDGGCIGIHKDIHMCERCIRGFVHHACNLELKWLERAIRAGRIPQPAPDVARYLAGRPFREHIGG